MAANRLIDLSSDTVETPETVAAAKLVPEARQRPPPTQAPGTSRPGAMTPYAR